MEMAKKANAPVAFLFGVPNQPLLGRKREDALIAETFVRYLQSDDESWPLLLPMTKSLVKAMDAIQRLPCASGTHRALLRRHRRLETRLDGLAHRAADPRVKAIAPLVIDTLNMQAQLPHQLKSYGRYSEMIDDT